MRNVYVLRKRLTLLLAFLGLSGLAQANNVQISTVSLIATDQLQFNISWENSWRITTPPSNYDGVWVFVKRRDCASNRFFHVSLSTTAADHTAASPLTVTTVSDGMGVFVMRSANGTGNISSTQVTLKMTGLPAGEYDFQVYGIEMVYVPQATFSVGDGAATNGFITANSGAPWTISSSGAITMSSGGANLWSAPQYGLSSGNTIPAAFPKGFANFWCMKYEISQGQYCDFLNSLANDQATNRNLGGAGSRYTISGSWPSFSATAPNRACNFMNWDDLLAYLDWAALSPMTEFEFEKVARGPVTPVVGEYAWGTTSIVDANTVTNDGTPTEAVSDAIPGGSGIANYNNNTLLGPLRVGFAATSSTNRMSSGSGYYGIMDLSGNVEERCVMVNFGTAAMSFTGLNGDGSITTSPTPGYADAANWPGNNAGGGTAATSVMGKGGSWAHAAAFLKISDRQGTYNNNTRFGYTGGRGVRR